MALGDQALSTIYRGDSRTVTVEVKNAAGQAINLTGQTVTLTLAKAKQDTPLCTLTNTDHYDAVGGITKFTITAEHTTAAVPWNYHLDIVVDDGDGGISTVYIGTVRIENRVSQVA